MLTPTPRFEDYLPVDVDRLRPNKSYDRMVEIRRERMRTYLGPGGQLDASMVADRCCPICDTNRPASLFMKEGFSFVRCGACGVIYVNPCLKPDHVKEVYAHQSYSDLVKSLVEASTAYRLERFGSERTQIINEFLPRQTLQAPRLLDVGCATGFFLQAAQADGWEVHGLEANPYQADYAKRQGLDVRSEAIEDTTLPNGYFDAVTLFEVIEHVPFPMDVLRKVHRLLREGGMIFVYTPNFDSAERLIMGQEAHFIWGSNHLTYFTADTLADALTRGGYVVEHAETQGLDIEDMIWYFENTGQHDMGFARVFRHQLQFLINSSRWGKNLRMYARKA